MNKFLFAAFAATWIIHLAYLGILGLGYKRIKRESEEQRRSDA